MPGDIAADLLRVLVENLKRAPDGWASLAMVIVLSEGEVHSTHGYLYSSDGVATATSARPSAIDSVVQRYLAGRYGPGETLPVALLVQFDRVRGEYEVTFEDADAARWTATPENLDEIRDELRPTFD